MVILYIMWTAMSYGLIIIGFAFLVGNAGTVFQASLAISGAMGGPIFALYLVGIFYPYATAPVGRTYTVLCHK
jgi:hypothetical protein